MRLYVLYCDDYGERVVGNLVNLSTFCESCGLACNNCRVPYGSFASDIYGMNRTPRNLPPIVEEPERYLPNDSPTCDLIMAIGVYPDLLYALPRLVEKTGAGGVLVPIEERGWCPPSVQKQLEEKLDEIGVCHAFPKPFCSLEEGSGRVIDELIQRYAVGKPRLKVELTGDRISYVEVVRSAPCGSTWYVAQQMKWQPRSRLEDVVAKAHHSYPCTASMVVDRDLKEPILHVAGYIIRDAVREAVGAAEHRRVEYQPAQVSSKR